jgi:hypothetical protein
LSFARRCSSFSEIVNEAVPPPESREPKIVLLVCLLAIVHGLIFSAAFPFFSVVDEQAHLDLVVRYSQGDIPRSLAPPCAEALPFIAIFGTPEYLWPPESQPGGHFATPPWKLPMADVQAKLLGREITWKETVKNHEVSQPPLYYIAAGLWWWFWEKLGLMDGPLLYMARFLNAFVIGAVAWLGWSAARRIFPGNIFIRLAVPALIACMPQTTFYAINNDVFSPLTFGLVFVLLLKFWEAENLAPPLAIGIGLALAATFLTKISNLPLLAVAGVFIALKIFRLLQNRKLRPSISALAILCLCATLPMAAWMAWCQLNFGDFTGSMLKIQFLGWTHKPFAEWFHHPIFTPPGLWYFLKGNLSSFWQGELLWQRQPLAIPAVDLVYVVLTLAAFAGTLAALLRRPASFSKPQRTAVWFSFLCLAAAFAFFALLSVKYDFQDCFYPSRAHPFFVSGRLMLGMLIPFLILFACGLDRLMQRCQNRTKFLALLTLLAFMLASEITIDWRIFPNDYNWFHL